MLHTQLLLLMYIWALFCQPREVCMGQDGKAHYRFNNFSTTLPVADPSWSSNCCAMGPVAEE